jgi:kynureninase
MEQSNMNTSLEFAQALDAKDPLRSYRDKFFIPKMKDGSDVVYMTGNSLGLQPKAARDYVEQEMKDWEIWGVEGHVHARKPWMPYHEFLTAALADITGSRESEVVVMNTLTANLHFMMISFYRPDKKRRKILIEGDAFPSDKYAVQSQLRYHGFDPVKDLIEVKARPAENCVRQKDILDTIEALGEEIALVMIGGVNYYTGQVHDMQAITKKAHEKGCMVGFDLAHGIGNLEISLHDIGMDFAAWCSYKYLNGGPGCIAGAFVHERHHGEKDIPRFEGWWGHDKATRFNMRHDFIPIPTVEAWQLSNPPILPMACLRASLDLFKETGMEALNKKTRKMNEYIDYMLASLKNDRIEVITPKASNERGCQVSIRVKNADKKLFDSIMEKGVMADWREPDVIRTAPVPLYNSFEDIYRFTSILESCL